MTEYTMFETKSGMVHHLVTKSDGTQVLKCSLNKALPKGTARTTTDTKQCEGSRDGVWETWTTTYKVGCYRCTKSGGCDRSYR